MCFGWSRPPAPTRGLLGTEQLLPVTCLPRTLVFSCNLGVELGRGVCVDYTKEAEGQAQSRLSVA